MTWLKKLRKRKYYKMSLNWNARIFKPTGAMQSGRKIVQNGWSRKW